MCLKKIILLIKYKQQKFSLFNTVGLIKHCIFKVLQESGYKGWIGLKNILLFKKMC
jgi:hypothetical protein